MTPSPLEDARAAVTFQTVVRNLAKSVRVTGLIAADRSSPRPRVYCHNQREIDRSFASQDWNLLGFPID